VARDHGCAPGCTVEIVFGGGGGRFEGETGVTRWGRVSRAAKNYIAALAVVRGGRPGLPTGQERAAEISPRELVFTAASLHGCR
jgi:hypothetical protein